MTGKHWLANRWIIKSGYILGIGLLWLVWSPFVQAQTTLTLDAYWAFLDELLPQVEALADLSDTEQIQTRLLLADQVAEITAVSLPTGQIIPITQSHLQTMLANPNLDPAIIARHLQNQLDSRHQWPPALVDRLDQQTLDSILNRPEFQYPLQEPTWWEQLWERVQLWFWEQISQLSPQISASNWLTGFILFITSLIIGLVLFFVLRRLWANFTPEAHLNLNHDPHLDNITADIALQRAQESSTAGDYRQAVRYLYLSTLLLLEERDLLRYDRALTNREYLNRLAHRPDLAAILQDVVDVFDRVWYGYQPLSEGEYGRFSDRVQTLKQQKGSQP